MGAVDRIRREMTLHWLVTPDKAFVTQQKAWGMYRNAPQRAAAGSRRAWVVTRAGAPAMHVTL